MLDFKELLIKAKRGDKDATEELLQMYRPLLAKSALIHDVFDEDLYQELCYRFIRCIEKFEF